MIKPETVDFFGNKLDKAKLEIVYYWKNKCEKTQTELERTRKALDVAVDALKKYTDASENWWYGYEFQGEYENYAGEYADKALEQIKALEQKDK